jgi:hypothetical protein
MSVKLMGAIFDLEIPSTEKLVLLAMADHAREDGTGCYPSVNTLARKTSLSKRGTQKLMRRLEAAGYIIDTGKTSRYQTIEYTLTLQGGEQGSLVFSGRGANLKTKRGEPECVKGANQETQTSEPRSPESLRTKDLTLEGRTERHSGGGCQDQESNAVTAAAAVARSFSAFGFDVPFGHPAFQTVVIKRSSELENGNLLAVMESVIQDCQQKVPPQFYDRKHALENEVREIEAQRESRSESEARDSGTLFSVKALQAYLRRNAAQLQAAAKRNAPQCRERSRLFSRIAKDLKHIAAQLASLTDIDETKAEQIERFLNSLEKEIYEANASEPQVHGEEKRHKLFLQLGVPRLSLFYFTDPSL